MLPCSHFCPAPLPLLSCHSCACFAVRAAQELQAPASPGELHGTFGQLVEELQACVLQRREGEGMRAWNMSKLRLADALKLLYCCR